MLWLFLALGLASADEACQEPLYVRFVMPEAGSTDVPRDVRVAVAMLGWGSAEDFTLRVFADDARLKGTEQSWCYEHEGPHELHCWLAWRPDELLPEDTEILLRVASVSGDSRSDHTFHTGTGLAVDPPPAPLAAVYDVWEEETGEPCDYPLARRYSLEATGGDPTEDGLSLVHIYEQLADGGEALVHTLATSSSPVDTGAVEVEGVKQFLDGSEDHTDCFRVVAENAAGEAGASAVACAEAPDTGPDTGPDTASDSGGSEPQPGDSGQQDTAPTDESETGEDADSDEAGAAPGSDGGGCGAAAAWLLGVVCLARRRPQPSAGA